MMNHKKLFFSLLLVLIISNAWVLATVALNRSQVVAEMLLSEREVRPPWFMEAQNSSMSVRLDHRVLTDNDDFNGYAGQVPAWLTTEKMRQLGFTGRQLELKSAANNDSKPVYIALEFNGAAYKASLAKIQARYDETHHSEGSREDYLEDQLTRELHVNSRLFAIDADTELAALQSRYQSRDNVFMVPGVITTTVPYDAKGEEYRRGVIASLAASDLYVPYPLNKSLRNLKYREYDDFQASRFEIEIKFGGQLIPWVSDVSLLPQSQD